MASAAASSTVSCCSATAVPSLLGEAVQTTAACDAGSGWIVNERIRAVGHRRCRRTLLPGGTRVAGRTNGRDRRELDTVGTIDDKIVTVAAQEIEFPVSPADEQRINVRGEVPELYFCGDLAGYGWCFRKGNYLNIGLGRLNSPGVSSHVQSFCDWLRERGKVCCDDSRAVPRSRLPHLRADSAQVGRRRGPSYWRRGRPGIPAKRRGDSAGGRIGPDGGRGAARSPRRLPSRAARLLRKADRRAVRRAANGVGFRLGSGSFLEIRGSATLSNRWFTRNVVLDRWFLHSGTPSLAALPAADRLSAAAACSVS